MYNYVNCISSPTLVLLQHKTPWSCRKWVGLCQCHPAVSNPLFLQMLILHMSPGVSKVETIITHDNTWVKLEIVLYMTLLKHNPSISSFHQSLVLQMLILQTSFLTFKKKEKPCCVCQISPQWQHREREVGELFLISRHMLWPPLPIQSWNLYIEELWDYISPSWRIMKPLSSPAFSQSMLC